MCSSNHAAAERWLFLVAERVGFYAKQRKEKRDTEWYQNLLAAGNAALWFTLVQYPDATKAFLRTVIDHSIVEAEYTDQPLFVPKDTRRKRVARGDDAGDFNRIPNDCLERAFAPDSWFTWVEVVETYEAVYALCESDIDQRIIEACWDNGESVGVGPPHYSTISAAVGVSSYKVRQRLDYLEAKYYRLTDHKAPTQRRQCRTPI